MEEVAEKELPFSVQEVADVIGRQKALHLIGRLHCKSTNGRRQKYKLHVPKHAKPHFNLSKIIGLDDAKAMSKEFAGITLHLAGCAEIIRDFRNQGIENAIKRNIPTKMIASWFGVTTRQIRYIRAGLPQRCGKLAPRRQE